SSEQAERTRRKLIDHASTKFESTVAGRDARDPIDDAIAEASQAIDVANSLGTPVMADLPDELVPTADDAFRDPEGAADTVAPRLQARAVKSNPRLAESLRKVTQGVTGSSPAMRHVTETLRDKIDAGTVTTDDVEA